MRFADRLASSLLSSVYPSSCPVCKCPSDNLHYAPICAACWSGIKRYTGPQCGVCAAPLSSEFSTTCAECLRNPPPFSRVLNFGIYSGALAEAIHLLKFSGLRRMARHLGRLLAEVQAPDADGIVPVPVTVRTLRERGFNQSLLLARAVSQRHKMPVYIDMLYKGRETLPQVGLGAGERRANLKNAFIVNGDLAGATLILLDDVMTTGATARECARSLVRAGAKEVIAMTFARSVMQ